jgi:hypothetical protein
LLRRTLVHLTLLPQKLRIKQLFFIVQYSLANFSLKSLLSKRHCFFAPQRTKR